MAYASVPFAGPVRLTDVRQDITSGRLSPMDLIGLKTRFANPQEWQQAWALAQPGVNKQIGGYQAARTGDTPISQGAVDIAVAKAKQNAAKVAGLPKVLVNTAPPANGSFVPGGAPTATARTTQAAGSPGTDPNAAYNGANNALAKALTGAGSNLQAPDLTLINPSKYAHAAANEQYDPQIAQLVAAMTAGKKGAATNQADIAKWFAGVDQLYKGARSEQQALGTKSAGQLDHTLDGLVATLGPQAGKSVAALSGVLQSEQSGMGRNEANFLSQMRPIAALQGAESHVKEQQYQDNLANAMGSKLSGLQGAKGQAFVKGLGDANQTLNQQRIAEFNAQATAAMLPYQMQGAVLSNAGKAQGIAQSAATFPLQVRQAQATIKKTIAAAGGQLNLGNASQRGQLVAAIQKGMGVGPNGLTIGPGKAWSNAQDVLEFAGKANDPQAIELAQHALRLALTTSHGHGAWKKFSFNAKGQIVKS